MSSSGSVIRTLGSGRGSALGQLSGPNSAALDVAADIAVVTDFSNHRLQMFRLSTGTALRTLGSGKGSDLGQLDSPFGVALDVAADI
eukprot:CAMPEP_0175947174 /NCGR_PEP_ID=MMETSP0108-20121206/27736_1 /TAXON_ID=195067 ORGANISM="Goniomonas pacifica, Strain CCMP1869" /NCGR_SAMPLE_ID=MMETSP0108 /ASSEMBLY_ACC=CAM_ASM_000204 /LENGTH=86 /DNA_ID=CAMNT_0017272769 /DNA_START=24 /DNA_END=281 /DNA_ORIENTATION=-